MWMCWITLLGRWVLKAERSDRDQPRSLWMREALSSLTSRDPLPRTFMWLDILLKWVAREDRHLEMVKRCESLTHRSTTEETNLWVEIMRRCLMGIRPLMEQMTTQCLTTRQGTRVPWTCRDERRRDDWREWAELGGKHHTWLISSRDVVLSTLGGSLQGSVLVAHETFSSQRRWEREESNSDRLLSMTTNIPHEVESWGLTALRTSYKVCIGSLNLQL